MDLKMSNDAASFIAQSEEYDTINLLYNNENIDITYHDAKEGVNSIINKIGWLFLIKKNERPSFEEIKKELN
jgi:hypothetical protein